MLDYLILSNPAAAASIRTAGYRRSTPVALLFDVFEFELEALPTVHTLFPKSTPDPPVGGAFYI
jgi:hypothetical protein